MLRDTAVIIVAAGHGSRFGGELPKQYIELGGKMLVLHAVETFLRHPAIAEVILVLPPEDLARIRGDLNQGPIHLVAGGQTRSASVSNGLAVVDLAATIVLVHDGARPLVSRDLIDSVITQARTGTAAVPALAVSDTLKRADREMRVLDTVPRTDVWAVQTPQGFPRDMLERAFAAATNETEATDDAMMVEALAEPVVLVAGSARNIKITTPHDLKLAAWLLDNP